MDFSASTTAQQRERLAALRDHLRAQELDGLLVPLADEYMNEYVPPCAQRLAWLTGFTGSAGMAAVGLDKAALFIDGRYTLQAEQQVDKALYELRHVVREPLDAFLKTHLRAGQKWGYDPWLHTRASIEKLRAVCTQAGAKLIALASHPIDALWADRPAPPCTPIFTHPLSYAGEEGAAKIARLAADLDKNGLKASVMTSAPSIAWLLNVRGHDLENTPLPLSYLILHAEGRVDWFVDPRKLPPETRARLAKSVSCHPQERFLPALKDLGYKKMKVRVDARMTPSAVLDTLADTGAILEEGADPAELPKACKNAVELDGIRQAHVKDGLALTRFLCWFAREGLGKDEVELEEKLLSFRHMDKDFLYPSFPSISGAGPNGAIVHYRASATTRRTLRAGDLYLIDSGGQYPFGTTDVTRTLACGLPTAAMKRHFTLVLKGHIALACARFPKGTHGGQLDVLARGALWAEGLDFDHGTGHGVGAFLGVHEGPHGISARSTVPLQPGMIVSNEPGYYLSGSYGIRIENLVAVRESAIKMGTEPMLEFETLTLAPMDLALIESDRLTTSEKAWLNAYHAAVYAAHESTLSADEKSWLKAATRALL